MHLELLIDYWGGKATWPSDCNSPNPFSPHIWLFRVKRCSVIMTTTSIDPDICMQIGQRRLQRRAVLDWRLSLNYKS